MPPKRRAYELAKEFNIPNKDFVALLKDGGFSVNTHMTAFDEFEEIRIRAWLEAQGYGQKAASASTAVEEPGDLSAFRKPKKKKVVEAAPEPADDDVGGLSQFRKAKKKKVEEPIPTPEITDAPPAAEAEPASEESQAVGEPEVSSPTEEPTQQAPENATSEEPVAEATAEPITEPVAEVEAPADAEGEDVAEQAAPTEPVVEPPAGEEQAQPEAPVEAPVAESSPSDDAGEKTADAATAEAPAADAATDAPTGDAQPAAPGAEGTQSAQDKPAEGKPAEGKAAEGIVRPSDKRRGPKIVGRIDLSKIQPTRPARRESRRLGRSDDSAVSNVQPTYGGRRRGGGGGPRPGGGENRGDLTASQLREREAGRFLRRQRPGGGQTSGGRRGRGGHRESGSQLLGSPFRGQSVKVEEPISIKKLAEALAIKQNQLLGKAFDRMDEGIKALK